MEAHGQHALLVVLCLVAGALGACGDSGATDKGAIRTILVEGVQRPVAYCVHLSAKLEDRLGGTQACRRAAKRIKADPDPVVDAITVAGDHATATLGAGASTRVSLVKEDGGWRLERLPR